MKLNFVIFITEITVRLAFIRYTHSNALSVALWEQLLEVPNIILCMIVYVFEDKQIKTLSHILFYVLYILHQSYKTHTCSLKIVKLFNSLGSCRVTPLHICVCVQ